MDATTEAFAEEAIGTTMTDWEVIEIKISKTTRKHNENKTKERNEDRIPVTFDKSKEEHTKVKHKFIVFGEEWDTSVETVIYKGTNDEELLIAVKEIWDMIDEYDLLPVEPDVAPWRTRESNGAIIDIKDLPPAAGAGARAESLTNRKVTFRAAKNILKTSAAENTFRRAMDEGKQEWNDKTQARLEEAQVLAIEEALRADTNMNPENVPQVALSERLFHCGPL